MNEYDIIILGVGLGGSPYIIDDFVLQCWRHWNNEQERLTATKQGRD